jgi:hypothetical protein
MACYILGCKNCEKEIEKICSYETAKTFQCECGEIMEILPSRSRFRIEGFSSLNNYTRPEFNYAGEDCTW